MDEKEPQYEPSDFTQSGELAEYLTKMYKDPETSSFEKTMAGVGLQAFWVGCEMNRLIQMFSIPVEEQPHGHEPPRMN